MAINLTPGLPMDDDPKKRVRDYIMAKYFQAPGQPAPEPLNKLDLSTMPVVSSEPPPPAPDPYSPEERAKLGKSGSATQLIGEILAGLGDAFASSRGTGGTKFGETSRAISDASRAEKLATFDAKKKAVQSDAVRKYLAEKYNLPENIDVESGEKLATLKNAEDMKRIQAEATSQTAADRKALADERIGLQRERIGNQEAERDKMHDEKLIRAKTDITTKFNSDAAVKKAQQSMDAASTIRELATSGNPIAAAAIPTYMARMSGEVGNLSEADKKPFGGSRAILQRVEASLKQSATGTLTAANQTYILGIVDLIEKKSNANLDRLAKSRAGQYSKADSRLNSDEIYQMLRPGDQIQSGAESPRGTNKIGRFEVSVE